MHIQPEQVKAQDLHWIRPDGAGMRYMRRQIVIITCMAVGFLFMLPWIMRGSWNFVTFYLDDSMYEVILPFAMLCTGMPIIVWLFYFMIAGTAIGAGGGYLAIRKGRKVVSGGIDRIEYTDHGIAVNGVSLVLATRTMGSRLLPFYNEAAYAEHVLPLLEQGRRVSALRMAWLHATSLNARYTAMALMAGLLTGVIYVSR